MKCCLCIREATEHHHIKSRGSGGGDHDWNLLDVCRYCHIKIHQYSWVKVIDLYPEIEKVLNDKGWVLETILGHRKLRRK
jgi:hypothetical protein